VPTAPINRDSPAPVGTQSPPGSRGPAASARSASPSSSRTRSTPRAAYTTSGCATTPRRSGRWTPGPDRPGVRSARHQGASARPRPHQPCAELASKRKPPLGQPAVTRPATLSVAWMVDAVLRDGPQYAGASECRYRRRRDRAQTSNESGAGARSGPVPQRDDSRSSYAK
jgi:hypothetical protein